MKRCSKCEEIKPYSEFYKDKASRDGHNYTCKECASVQAKTWQASNYERVLKNVSAYCKESAKDRARRKNKEHKKRVNPSGAATLTPQEWLDVLEECNYLCVYCDAPWEHMDHFVPLALGGEHTKENVVPACAPCNLRKGSKNPIEFIAQLENTKAQSNSF